MKRNHRISGLACGVLACFVGGVALGESCPVLVGDWDVASESSSFDFELGAPDCPILPSASGACFRYVNSTGTLRIEGQSGCLFYGYYERTDEPEPRQPLAGAIGPGLRIKMTGGATIVDGSLVGPRKISAMASDLAASPAGTVNTSRVTATKR